MRRPRSGCSALSQPASAASCARFLSRTRRGTASFVTSHPAPEASHATLVMQPSSGLTPLAPRCAPFREVIQHTQTVKGRELVPALQTQTCEKPFGDMVWVCNDCMSPKVSSFSRLAGLLFARSMRLQHRTAGPQRTVALILQSHYLIHKGIPRQSFQVHELCTANSFLSGNACAHILCGILAAADRCSLFVATWAIRVE